MEQTIDPKIKALVSAIGEAETGPSKPEAYTMSGKSGEFGRYQYMPETWKEWSREFGVNENDKSIEAQNKVAYNKVKQWKEQGLNPAQIASKWNSGDENKYKQGWKGTNSQGVQYDTPAYALKVSENYRKLSSGYNPKPFSQPSGAGTINYSGVENKTPVAPVEEKNPDSLGSQLQNRGQELSGAIKSIVGGKAQTGQTRISGLIQSAGALAGGLGDVVGAGMDLIPGVKQIENLLGQGVGKLAQTPVGQSVIKEVQKFSESHPELAKDIGAGFNIVTAIPIFKGLKVATNVAGDAIAQALRPIAEKSFTQGLPELITSTKGGVKFFETNPNIAKEMLDRRLVGDIKGGKYEIGDSVNSSWKTITESNDEIKNILNRTEHTLNPEYTPASLIGDVLEKFPNSNFTPDTILKVGKNLTPQNGKLWDKFASGELRLNEINKLRSDLDTAVKSVYSSIAQPPIKKKIGQTLADTMRNFVKTQAKETVPLFDEMTTQFNIQKALALMENKAVKPGSIAGFTGHAVGIGTGGAVGGLIGGTPGALIGGMIGDKASTSIANKLAGKNITQGILKKTGRRARLTPIKKVINRSAGMLGGVEAQKAIKP